MGSDSRRSIDWEAVHREYRAGQLSVREIARQFGNIAESGIRRKAKAEGWKRDLTHRVREKVRTELVRTEVAQCAKCAQKCAQNQNCAQRAHRRRDRGSRGRAAVKMIELHRQDIATQRELIRGAAAGDPTNAEALQETSARRASRTHTKNLHGGAGFDPEAPGHGPVQGDPS